jgi:hypothetical protein
MGNLAFLLAFALYLRRKRMGAMFLAVPGLLLGSCGLLWLVPAFGLNNAPLSPYLVNGFPTWDLFCLGVAHHGSPLTHSVLAPMVVCVLALALRFLRPFAAGFSAGVAGHLAFVALYSTVEMGWLPEGMQPLWLWANVFVCVALSAATAARD